MKNSLDKETCLYIDMDGTLCEFVPAERMEDLYVQGYFLNLRPLRSVLAGIRCFMKKYPQIKVCVLSAFLGDSKWALQEKALWLSRNIPELSEDPCFVKCGTLKSDVPLAGENAFLLDDHSPNLCEWEAAGFKGVKLLNGINGKGKTWKGATLSYMLPPEEFADELYAYINA